MIRMLIEFLQFQREILLVFIVIKHIFWKCTEKNFEKKYGNFTVVPIFSTTSVPEPNFFTVCIDISN